MDTTPAKPVTESESWETRIIRERAETHARHLELYQGIAAHLTGWKALIELTRDHTAERPEYRYRLVLDTPIPDKEIGLTFGRDAATRGKVGVHGSWPRRAPQHGPFMIPKDVGESDPGIHCSLSRGYPAIARDIERRFLPEYLRIWDKLQGKLDADNSYQDRKLANWKRMIDAGVVVNPRGPGGGNQFISGSSEDPRGEARVSGAGYGDIRMTGENSVEIHLRSLPVDTAIRVLKALKRSAMGNGE